MEIIKNISSIQWPPTYRREYDASKGCFKCGSGPDRLNIIYVPKGIQVMVANHVHSMPKDGFISQCNTCDYEFIQTLSDEQDKLVSRLSFDGLEDYMAVDDLRYIAEVIIPPAKSDRSRLIVDCIRKFLEHKHVS